LTVASMTLPVGGAEPLEWAEARAMADVYRAAAEARPESARILERGPAVALAATEVDLVFFNRSIGLGAGVPAMDEDLDATVDFYRGLRRRVAIAHIAPDALPADIGERLSARGFAPWTRWAKCWRPIDGVPDGAAAVDRPVATIRIERIDRGGATDFGAIAVSTFALPAESASLLTAPIGRSGWTHYLGWLDERPVSIGAMFVADRIAWFGYGATLTDARRRGGQTGMLAARLRDAADLGCRMVVTETTEDRPDAPNPSFRNLTRAGFRVGYLRSNWMLRNRTVR
jgi:hypothetical protein